MQFLNSVKALVKAEQSEGRVVCVLTPNKKWFRHLMVAGIKPDPGYCWIRSSANLSELKTVTFDTLITIQLTRPEGYGLAREGLRLSKDPRTIQFLSMNGRDL